MSYRSCAAWPALLVLVFTGGLSGGLAAQEQPTEAATSQQIEAADQETQTGRTRRQIEELVVTAERRQATVSDTSIAISAIDGQMLEDLGITGPDDMIEFLPATTRDTFDIRIRGVGRNFRTLGGDPGVATYVNGVFSEDFLIAATEGGLYDVERVEALRGPQGTLYGRNAIGGAMNYLLKEPTFDWTGEVRTRLGRHDTNEYYGFISGPITDTLAMRFTGSKLLRGSRQSGLGGSKDLDTTNDQNVAFQLLFEPTANFRAKVRFNDRQVENRTQQSARITEGPAGARGVRNTEDFVIGLREVEAGTEGALAFENPLTGETHFGAPLRPGVDVRGFPHMPNNAFQDPVARLNQPDRPGSKRDLNFFGISRVDPQSEAQKLTFDQNAVTGHMEWDITPGVSIRYIGGYQDFDFFTDSELGQASRAFASRHQPITQESETWSHELQLLWDVGDRFSATSGLYVYNQELLQDVRQRDPAAQGRVSEPADYGMLEPFLPFVTANPHQGLFDAEPGTVRVGRWDGNEASEVCCWENTTDTRAYAVFTQGTYQFNPSWALTLGVRWARDEKEAEENRFLYVESAPEALDGVLSFALGEPISSESGITTLAAINVLMGNAELTGDPENPIEPVCELDALECDNPLRLGGIPLSWSANTGNEDDWSRWTWRVNLDWTPDDDTLVYLSATTGHRAGGFALGVGLPVGLDGDITGPEGQPVAPSFTYDSERVFALELGYKGMFFDRTLQINSAVYNYRYTNYQDDVNIFDETRQENVSVVENAPGARNTGVEIEAYWLATDALTLSGNYSYTNTEYTKDFFLTDLTDPSLPSSVFGGVNENPELFTKNVKGNSLKLIPEHKASIWGSYEWSTDWGSILYRASWSYTGSMYSEAFEEDRFKVPHRARVDTSVTWMNPSRDIRVRAFVENVFDDIAVRSISNSTASGNFAQTGNFVQVPRFWGLDVRWNFL